MADIKRYTCLYEGGMEPWHEGNYVLHSDHLAAIKTAVAAEREACAKVVDAVTDEDWSYYRQGDISDRIRARGAANE